MLIIQIQTAVTKKRLRFSKEKILIGTDTACDVLLNEENADPEHLQIDFENGSYVVTNLSASPTTTYNGLPFGKRKITKDAKITLGKTTLRFEITEEQDTKEAEESSETTEMAAPYSRSFIKRLALILGIASFLGLIVLGTYVNFYVRTLNDRDQEELTAARGLADAAAALLYAKLHQINPPHHNWSDPYYLNQLLNQIIPKSTCSFCNLDVGGLFKNTPYLFRVYTNDDGSHFLLIAQPETSLLRWLQPQDALVIDSHEMKLYKVNDIQPINRLLFSSGELTSVNSKKINHYLQLGEVISLDTLAAKESTSLFSPPRELSSMNQAAAEKLYNAPRYYKLSEPILKEILVKSNSEEISMALERFADLPDLVFYTPEGIKTAADFQEKISNLLPNHPWLVGFFRYDAEKESPLRTELLVKPKIDPAIKETKKNNFLYQTLLEATMRRKKALAPVTSKLTDLLEHNLLVPEPHFKKSLIHTLAEYDATDTLEKRKIQKIIGALHGAYVLSSQEISQEEFDASLHALGLQFIPPATTLEGASGSAVKKALR